MIRIALPSRRCLVAFALMWLWMITPAARGADPVKIVREEVKVEYKTFDPRNLPDPPPPLEGEEAAVCVYQFGVNTNFRYGYRAPANPDRPVSATIVMSGVDVTVSLSMVIWLPEGVTEQLKKHEEGHRAIAEHFYKDAEAIARRHARKAVARRIPIRDRDLETAARAEIEKLSKQVCAEILADLDGPCGRAQDHYDKITDHSRKNPPTSEEAVKIVLEKAGKEKAGGKR